jgi:hypothetical protein
LYPVVDRAQLGFRKFDIPLTLREDLEALLVLIREFREAFEYLLLSWSLSSWWWWWWLPSLSSSLSPSSSV